MANPFVHVELNSTDVTKAKAFYEKLFDWNLSDTKMPTGTYTMIDPGDDGTGGGMTQSPVPNMPSFWLAYALVDDVRAATDKAKSLGGNVMQDVTEIPEMGWFSVIVDPTGATLGLWQSKN